MTVLSIDQGTSATKAVVVDPENGVVAMAERAVRPTYLADGGVEQDPGALLASVLDAGRQAVALAGRRIDAVTVANQGETVLAWDPVTGDPLSPAIVWQDRRSEALCAARAEARGWVAQRSGLALDPYFSAPKMAWLRANVTTSGVVSTADAWLVHHLTGEFVTDVTTASRSLLVDLDRVRWDPELLELFALGDEPLARIVACDEIVGSTTAFGSEVPVTGLIVDQQAALLAEGCLRAGLAKCTFGTGAFVLANTGPGALRSTAGLSASVAWRARGETSYCVDGQAYTAASAIRWLRDLGLVRAAADLDNVAAEDAGGVVCVPALAGLGAPWWRPGATASFTGMTLSTGRGQLVTAVLEGIAALVAEITGAIDVDVGAPMERLAVDGGLTRCRTLMQATADLIQAPVEVFASPHATALGTAALGHLALDPSLTLARAVPDWAPAATFEPRWSPGRAREHRGRWRAALAAALDQAPGG